MLEQGVGPSWHQRQDARAGQGDDADGADIERVDVVQLEAHGDLRAHGFLGAAQSFQHGEDGHAKARFGEQFCQCCRSVLVRGEGEDTNAGMKMRADQVEREAMQRDRHRFLQRPAQPGGGEAEGGRVRKDRHFAGVDLPGQRGADAEMERIARGQHAGFSSLQRHDGGNGIRERRKPGARFARDGIGGEVEMAGAAEDHFGLADRGVCRCAETGQSILADTDYGEPAHAPPPVERGE